MLKLIRIFHAIAFPTLIGLLLCNNLPAQCAFPANNIQYETLNSDLTSFKVYPSMAPRTYLKISYASFAAPEFIDPNILSNFVIVKAGDDCSKRLKVEKIERVTGINYLIFDAKSNGLGKDDKVNVGLIVERRDQNGKVIQTLKWDSDDGSTRRRVSIPIENHAFTITPSFAPDQELTDGTKRSVAQVRIKLDFPSLIKNNNVARFYAQTDNLISSNWKDKNSKLELRVGAERSLTGKWYVPVNLEVKVNGDQRLKNATFVTSGGLKTILPWAWTKKSLFNSLIRAPVSPEFGVAAEYHHRMKQDAASRIKFPKKGSFALAGQFTWLPIQFFTRSCQVKDQNGNDTGVENFDKCFSAQNISLELSAKGWWFPYEKTLTGNNVKRFEGRGEVSLLIPITNIADQLLFRKTGDATSRVRIKYVIGANDAAGFKRVKQLTFGIELIK